MQGGVLTLRRDAVAVFYSATWLGSVHVDMSVRAFLYMYM